MKVTKIVITGGPCGGKTTGMSWIQREFTEKGYKVLFVPETATELILGGLAPWTCRSNEEFQKCLFKLQIEKEKIFELAAQAMDVEKVLIVCDRGLLDNKAYMNEEEFTSVINSVNDGNSHLGEIEFRDNYDAVFHLVTAANGAEEFYTNANNQARTETKEDAIAIDNRIIAAWTGHPHFRMIDNSTGFEGKMMKLIKEIASFLGEPQPYEFERKFLIEYPDIEALEALPNCKKVDIVQTYLVSEEDEELRVRQRGCEGHYIYFETRKKSINQLKRIELEQKLTKDEYLERLNYADPSKRVIVKRRYCLSYNGYYYELDVFPFWKDKAILEIDLCDINDAIEIPPMLKVIKEVTGDKAYKNASLAQRLP